MNKRETFSNKFGFIASCIGAALGLGNIWMFSYRLGSYGGAAFLVPYFIFILLFATTGLITEFSFGRHFKGGSLKGIRTLFDRNDLKFGKVISSIPAIGLIGVFMFYSVVIGWILKYFFISVTGQMTTLDSTIHFDSFAGTSSTIPWFVLAMVITAIIVCLGVNKGIEKLNKFIMPLLLVLFTILLVRSLTLPGATEGVRYLLVPDWSHLFNLETWVMALGQAFFTVSLNGCGMVVYGSYIDESFDIPSAALNTALFDTLAALLAAFIIMPAVFAFGLDPAAGPSLLFITLPKVFQAMPYTTLFSTLFFFSVVLAAISSSINMLEGSLEALTTATSLTRIKGAILITSICAVLTLPLATNMMYFDAFADMITIVISPLGIVIVTFCFFFLFKKNEILSAINVGSKRPVGDWIVTFGKFVFTSVTVIVILFGIMYGGIG